MISFCKKQNVQFIPSMNVFLIDIALFINCAYFYIEEILLPNVYKFPIYVLYSKLGYKNGWNSRELNVILTLYLHYFSDAFFSYYNLMFIKNWWW